MAARLSEMALAVILGCAALWIGLHLGMSLVLLVEKGVLVPVAVPVLAPRAVLVAMAKAGAALTPTPAEA